MRILLICEDIGCTAPGIVSNNVGVGLAKYADVDVLTSKVKGAEWCFKNIFLSKKLSDQRLDKVSFYSIGTSFLSYSWLFNLPKFGSFEYDLILCVVSMYHYGPLLVGEQLKKNRISHKLFAFFVDAIPAPYPYLKEDFLRRRICSFIRKHTQNVDVIFSTCKEMSSYQSGTLNTESIKFEELYNPSKFSSPQKIPIKSKEPVFLYTGGLYPPRTPQFIIAAFCRLLDVYPNAKFIFVGSAIDEYLKSVENNKKKRFVSVNYTDDLVPYFEQCTCLVDIGTTPCPDIYLSSKIIGYLYINRPILCETSEISAARRLFSNLRTVFLCGHDEEEIYSSMKSIVENNYANFTERDTLLEKMTKEAIAVKILSYL